MLKITRPLAALAAFAVLGSLSACAGKRPKGDLPFVARDRRHAVFDR